jgi:hypothetical protein
MVSLDRSNNEKYYNINDFLLIKLTDIVLFFKSIEFILNLKEFKEVAWDWYFFTPHLIRF